MNDDLWFVYEDGYVVSVFEDRKTALKKLNTYKAEDPDTEFELVCITADELTDYPEEFDLAQDAGLA